MLDPRRDEPDEDYFDEPDPYFDDPDGYHADHAADIAEDRRFAQLP